MIRVKKSAGSITVVIITLLLCGETFAQGTSGYEILRVQTQPRGSALGGSLIADEGFIDGIFYNPAGLAALPQRTASAGYMNYLVDMQSGFATYVDPRQSWGVWGVTLTYTNYGTFEGRDPTGVQLPDFTANDVVLQGVYARPINDKINVGGGVKFIQSDIEDYTARAVALDVGGQYTVTEDKFRVGAGIFNLGATVDAYDEYKDDLPLYYRLGIWGIPEGFPASLSLSVTLYQEYMDNYSLGSIGSNFGDFIGDLYFAAGAEFHPITPVYLRIGYDTIGFDQHVDTQKDVFAGISFGFGVDINVVTLDYGLASYGELGFVQRLGIRSSF
ncbi:PorV/PorQ family protein [bacterium]|nr:PorV/PorQ family protein [bacterium]MBU1651399.1 PorV/PorQ family protein [bacterium]